MGAKTYIGLDNGTGSLGIIRFDGKVIFGAIPSKKEQSYTKKQQGITRVDHIKLHEVLSNEVFLRGTEDVFVIIERPFTGSAKHFKAIVSGMRALEAVLTVVERLGLPYQYIDSREWQKTLLPEGIKGTADLKLASLQIGTRLFPQVESKHKDRDGLLIALYAQRKGW